MTVVDRRALAVSEGFTAPMLGKKPKVLPAQPEVDGVVRQHLVL
ncbi:MULTISPECIES: hypothetical protein [unclassified Streptomyces]|nr:hypothetical protein [Streptomyces sp. ADI95-17]WSG55369.1 hypothetical protein OHA38_39330 [Streptomyces sp. NBC_01732]WSX06505.1 hypothetical protein OG355_42205 [Streptomyces sp. NBC_00987]